MYNIKHGYGCGIKATLLTASGEVCDLRRARYKGAVLVLPNGSTIPCADVSVDDITNTMYVRLLGDRELTTIGRYGILFNVKLANGVMYSSPIVMFADVQDDAEMEYRELNISIAVTVTYLPSNVAYTGSSPKISPNGTWLVYNDELNAYEDTGEPASYAGLTGEIQEVRESVETRTTTTFITEAVDVDWKTVGKNADGKLCVIGGDTQVADFIEGYLQANEYAKMTAIAQIYASMKWVEGKKYITASDIPSLVSAFTNDKGYITRDAIAPYAKKATTLGGYGITNAYTKEETNSKFFATTKIDGKTIKRDADGFMYVDFDGLPIDNETIYWDNGILKALGGGGGGGGVADSVAWVNVTGKPTWITDTKPKYDYSEILNLPDLSLYVSFGWIEKRGFITASALNGYATQSWVEDQGYLTEITSGDIESILGYQPYDGDANHKGFLTASALNGYATETFVNTALSNYLPKSGIAVGASTLANYFSSRPTSATPTAQSNGTMIQFKATSSMTEGKPSADAHVLHFYWDANSGYNAQFAIPNNPNGGHPQWRAMNGTTWGDWITLLDSGNFTDYALSLSGGTINGLVTISGSRADGGKNYVLAPFFKTSYCHLNVNLDNSFRTTLLGINDTSNDFIKPFRLGGSDQGMLKGNYAPIMAWGVGDTHAFINISPYATNKQNSQIGGGVGDKILWTEYLLHSGNFADYALPKDGNAVSATKLETARSIWGQSFDGTGGVNGHFTSTGGHGGFTLYAGIRHNEAISIERTSHDGTWLGLGIALNLDGNVGIGTVSPSEKLEVSGNVKATKFIGDVSGNAATATKLESSVNIWGQSFDGTGNVYGPATMNGSSVDLFWKCEGSQYALGFGIGSGNTNRGIYDFTNNSWLMYRDATLNIYFPKGNMCIGASGEASSTNRSLLNIDAFVPTNSIQLGSVSGNMLSIGVAGVYGTHIYTTGDGNGHINVCRSDANPIAYNLLLQELGGNVAVGGTTASAKLHVHGNLLTEGGITMYSQRSLKNILSYDGLSLEQLSMIQPIKFTWKDGRDNRYHVGGIADDVQSVIPEVIYRSNDYLTMDYGNAGFYVAASLIKPVVDHEQRIKVLESENKALREEIRQLKQTA